MYGSAKWVGAFVCMCQTGRRVHRDMSNKVVWILCMNEMVYECVTLSGGACSDMQHIGKQAFVLSASWTHTCHAKQWPTPSNRWAFNMNCHLSCFFLDLIGFWCLQVEMATLISGLNALQFLDHTIYNGSDLDLYTHPRCGRIIGQWLIQQESYTFVHNRSLQSTNFSNVQSTD